MTTGGSAEEAAPSCAWLIRGTARAAIAMAAGRNRMNGLDEWRLADTPPAPSSQLHTRTIEGGIETTVEGTISAGEQLFRCHTSVTWPDGPSFAAPNDRPEPGQP